MIGSLTGSVLHLAPAVLAVIGTVSGHPVQVHCNVEHGGYVDVMGHSDRRLRLIELHPRLCRRLDTLLVAPAPTGSPAFAAESEALLVAMHEAVHLSAYGAHADEAEVECRAVQLVASAAVHLGLSEAQADALGHAALRFHQRLPGPGDWRVGLHEMPDYQSPDCYDGGPLDIDPESSDWPNAWSSNRNDARRAVAIGERSARTQGVPLPEVAGRPRTPRCAA